MIIDDDKNKNKKGKKITDYFAPRRTSNRKTQETIREEKQQLLIKLILDETEDGLQVIITYIFFNVMYLSNL